MVSIEFTNISVDVYANKEENIVKLQNNEVANIEVYDNEVEEKKEHVEFNDWDANQYDNQYDLCFNVRYNHRQPEIEDNVIYYRDIPCIYYEPEPWYHHSTTRSRYYNY